MSQEKTMSPSQIAANQANGRQSQGPTTEQGRQNSRFSRLRHGFYIQSFEEAMVALGEDRAEFERLEQDLIAYWRPSGAFRESLVRRLARALWRQQRCDKAECGETVRQLEALEADCDDQDRQLEAGARPLLVDLNYLLRAVRQRDFSDGRQMVYALNRLRRQRVTARLERVYELLCQPPGPGDAEGSGGDDEEPEMARDAGPMETGEAGEFEPANQEAACAEAESLLEEELRQAIAADNQRKLQAGPSPAEWSARLAPATSLVLRWQGSLAREADRLVKLLSALEARDETLTNIAKRFNHNDMDQKPQAEDEK